MLFIAVHQALCNRTLVWAPSKKTCLLRCLGLEPGPLLAYCCSRSDCRYSKVRRLLGDVDLDSLEDVLLVGKKQLVLLHGDIAVPMIIPAPANIAFLGLGQGFLAMGRNGLFPEGVSLQSPVAFQVANCGPYC